jgi:hypothetical protein
MNPRGSRPDLWGAAGEIPAAYPADVAVDLERRGPAGRPWWRTSMSVLSNESNTSSTARTKARG